MENHGMHGRANGVWGDIEQSSSSLEKCDIL
jgi:hypothetical protein